jgi:hypothetical protein
LPKVREPAANAADAAPAREAPASADSPQQSVAPDRQAVRRELAQRKVASVQPHERASDRGTKPRTRSAAAPAQPAAKARPPFAPTDLPPIDAADLPPLENSGASAPPPREVVAERQPLNLLQRPPRSEPSSTHAAPVEREAAALPPGAPVALPSPHPTPGVGRPVPLPPLPNLGPPVPMLPPYLAQPRPLLPNGSTND